MLQTDPVADLDQVARRLNDEFGSLAPGRVRRCVHDAWNCAEHLGYRVTPVLVERVARERLQAAVMSAPPSERCAAPRAADHDLLS
ncbi:three-helix bundle dimerization domain-containing protein [Nocardiopsis coralliicola]